MSSRALQIVTQLSNAPEQTMTSQELAERIGVSAHTIKNEMPQVAQILNENGARLVSRRHKGYYVEVLDPEAYDTFFGCDQHPADAGQYAERRPGKPGAVSVPAHHLHGNRH